MNVDIGAKKTIENTSFKANCMMLNWVDDRIRLTHSLALPGAGKITGITSEIASDGKVLNKATPGVTFLKLYKDNGLNNYFDISFKDSMKGLKTYITLDHSSNSDPKLYSSWTFATTKDWDTFT